ncbi:MAG: hypothetical protein HYT93_00115 [Parcubacteria group bacterium]|nr:hypothetical protein [Parcubacteria group bacterium]
METRQTPVVIIITSGIMGAIFLFPYIASAISRINESVTVRGNVVVTGALAKGSGSFVIDHPLDPANKLLYHSFVESPDVKNIYFRYQFSSLEKPSPNLYIKQEIRNNRFVISGGEPKIRVSWQVTGVRHDPYILKNPIIPEVEKGSNELVNKGEYVFPELYD